MKQAIVRLICTAVCSVGVTSYLATAGAAVDASTRLAARPAPTKPEMIARLKLIQDRNIQEAASIEEAMKRQLQLSTAVGLKKDSTEAGRKLTQITERIESLDERREELMARRMFVDQLILQIDTKWSGQPLQEFLEHRFLDMAVTDLANPAGDVRLWKFLTYLSVAVREIPEQREDVLGIVESFMAYSGIVDPKSPAEFAANRQYTSGSMSLSANPVSREKLGDQLEAQLKAIEQLKKGQEKPKAPVANQLAGQPNAIAPKADIELRLKPLTAPVQKDDVAAEATPESASSTESTSGSTSASTTAVETKPLSEVSPEIKSAQ